LKILKLRFQNINSLGGVHAIDFTQAPFSETGIFAITGATGSGKSSILDAITLALFNQTPRTGQLSVGKITDYGSIITNNANEASSEIEYEVQGKVYLSKWAIHRAKRSRKLQDYSMEISDANGNILDLKKSAVPDKNAQIIGLNFDQFSKSVLLSQGEFAKFLKADNTQRSALLEKITGTEIYRKIGMAAFARKRLEEQNLKNLEIQIEGIVLLEPEVEDQYIKESKAITLKQPVNKENLEKLRSEIQVKQEILRLEKQKQELFQLKENQLEVKLKLIPYSQKLDLHDKILPLKADIQKRIELEGNNSKLGEKLTNLESTKLKLEAERKVNQEQFVLNNDKSDFLKKDYAQRQKNLLEESRKLATYEEAGKAVLRGLETAIKVKLENETLLNSQISKASNELQESQNKNTELIASLEKNIILKELPSILPLLSDRNKSVQNSASQAEDSLKKIIELFKFEENKKLDDFQFWNPWLSALLNDKKREVKEISVLLGDSSMTDDKVEADMKLLEDKFRALIELLKLAGKVGDDHKKIAKFNEKSESDEKLLQTKTAQRSATINENDILLLKIKELRTKRERQLLESKFKDARLKLIENEACFLCGSEKHPYKEHYKEDKNNVETEIQDALRLEDDLRNNISKLEKDISSLSTSLVSLKKQKDETESSFQALIGDFNKLKSQYQLSCKIENIVSITNEQNQIKEKGIRLRAVIDNRKKYKDLELQISNLTYTLEKVEVAEKETAMFQELISGYSPYLQKSNDVFEDLSKLNDRYKHAENQKVSIDKSIHELELIITEKNEQITKLSIDINNEKELISQKTIEIKETNTQFISILGKIVDSDNSPTFKTTVEAESFVRNSMEKVNKELASIENNITKLTENLKNTTVNLSETQKQLELNKKEALGLDSFLDSKLEENNLATLQDAENCILSQPAVNEMKTKLKDNEQALIKTESKIAENHKVISELSKADKSIDKVEVLILNLREKENEVLEKNIRLGELSAILQAEKVKKEKTKSIREAHKLQELELFKWQNLNELIGDSTGNKYVKFAQGLTLIQLIALANKHLVKLYPRYQIKARVVDNEIVIVDTYLANSERSVKTLSGGESFMTSLALALGLSDLAGKNTQIDCLFIDEGFGTLDPDALDTALTALENLQSQTNRTIGIISHVQALKDRIPVQIRLEKNGSGHSKFEVFDGEYPVKAQLN